jgi:hypothetical protein
VGDPSSLTIDPVRNFAYMLADPNICLHGWGLDCMGKPSAALFLVRVELSNPAPIPGQAPGGGCVGSTWNPTSAAIPLPHN